MNLRMYQRLRSKLTKLMRPFDPAVLVSDIFCLGCTKIEPLNKHSISEETVRTMKQTVHELRGHVEQIIERPARAPQIISSDEAQCILRFIFVECIEKC